MSFGRISSIGRCRLAHDTSKILSVSLSMNYGSQSGSLAAPPSAANTTPMVPSNTTKSTSMQLRVKLTLGPPSNPTAPAHHVSTDWLSSADATTTPGLSVPSKCEVATSPLHTTQGNLCFKRARLDQDGKRKSDVKTSDVALK